MGDREQRWLERVRSGALSDVQALVADRFEAAASWREIVLDGAQESWRRIAALQILVDRVVGVPCAESLLATEVLAPLHTVAEPLEVLGTLPFVSAPGDIPKRAVLPIRTSVGGTALYYAVDAAGTVTQAAVYPPFDEA